MQRGARSSNEVGNLTNYDDKEIGVITGNIICQICIKKKYFFSFDYTIIIKTCFRLQKRSYYF